MPDAYNYITLMCRLKAAQTRNKELESDERYIQLKKLHQKEYRAYEHKIQKLKAAIDDALDKVKELRLQFYETAARLEEEQGISVRPDGWKTEYFQRHDKQTKPGVCFKN